MRIITREEIDAVLPKLDLMAEIEQGFIAYSRGQAVVPGQGTQGEKLRHGDP